MRDPAVLPSVAAMTASQKFHGLLVIGSTFVGSDTRKPANGRISSDGRGVIADSIIIARNTPRYPTAPYSDSRNGMTILSMNSSMPTYERGLGGTGGRIADYPRAHESPRWRVRPARGGYRRVGWTSVG